MLPITAVRQAQVFMSTKKTVKKSLDIVLNGEVPEYDNFVLNNLWFYLTIGCQLISSLFGVVCIDEKTSGYLPLRPLCQPEP